MTVCPYDVGAQCRIVVGDSYSLHCGLIMAKKLRNQQSPNPLSWRIKKSETVWLDGPVPAGYWQYEEHRRMYLIWLGRKLGFRTLDDFYKIKTDYFKKNRGSGALLHCWQSSAIVAVTSTFPDHDWKEWLFVSCPRSFWKDSKNHARYMNWLAEQCDIQQPEDWYRITNNDFRKHKGGAFLLQYQSSISNAVMKHVRKFKFNEWMFAKTPKGFWLDRKNRVRYVKWLGKQLAISKKDQWYEITRGNFEKNHGNQLIKFYDGSPLAVIMDCFPKQTWHEWRFARVPVGFWKSKSNQERYLVWFEKQMKIRQASQWGEIRRIDLKQNYGGGLLALYPSTKALLKANGRTIPKQASSKSATAKSKAAAGETAKSNTRPKRKAAKRKKTTSKK